MLTKEKIYEQMAVLQLFGGNYNSSVQVISKSLEIPEDMVRAEIEKLQSEKRVAFDGDDVIDTSERDTGVFIAIDKKFSEIVTEGGKRIKIKNNRNFPFAFDQDLVEVAYTHKGQVKKTESVNDVDFSKRNNYQLIPFITKVTSRVANREFEGRVLKNKRNQQYEFVPYDDKIPTTFALPQNDFSFTLQDKRVKAKVSMISDVYSKNLPSVEISQIFGTFGDPITELRLIAKSNNLSGDFPEDVEAELEYLTSRVSAVEMLGRTDFRDKNFITIDPQGAKDKDDAICLEIDKDGNYVLYEANADVQYYVSPTSASFKEAKKRTTSAYIGDTCYPMLHPKLSNGICSLHTGCDRLVKCHKITMNKDFETIDYSLFNAVICSKKDFTYEEVQDILDRKNGKHIEHFDYVEMLNNLKQFTDAYFEYRRNLGGLQINSGEPQFEFSEDKKKVLSVKNHSQIFSTKIIEACMVRADEEYGKYCDENGILSVYRVHTAPKVESLARLNEQLKMVGIYKKRLDRKTMQEVLEDTNGTNLQYYTHNKILRAMQIAKSDVENKGHYATGLKADIQCTAGIRRLSDLLALYQQESIITGKPYPFTEQEVTSMVVDINAKEQEVVKAEREADKILYTIWATDHLGEVRHGVVCDVDKDNVYLIDQDTILYTMPHELKKDSKNIHINSEKKFYKYNIGDELDFKINKTDIANAQICVTDDLNAEIRTDKFDFEFANNN